VDEKFRSAQGPAKVERPGSTRRTDEICGLVENKTANRGRRTEPANKKENRSLRTMGKPGGDPGRLSKKKELKSCDKGRKGKYEEERRVGGKDQNQNDMWGRP